MSDLSEYLNRLIAVYQNPNRAQGDFVPLLGILNEVFLAGRIEQARVDREAVIGAEIPDIFKYACNVYLSALAAVAPKGEA